MSTFKILLTSQKGGVGKSTISANLAAYFRRQGEAVTLIDFDTHGSSSTWLSRAPNIGVVVQHKILPLDQGGNRPILDARLHLRRAATSSDVVICDLTWTDSIAGELMFEFDMVIVPTSVSEIELAATSGFLSRHRWVFDSAIHTPPTLLVCPTRVQHEQMNNNAFSKQRFPVSFMLSPPVLEAQTARDMFERGYLMDLKDACGASFNEFGKAVCAARDMRNAEQAMKKSAHASMVSSARAGNKSVQMPTARNNLLATSSTLSNQYSILGRHRLHKTRPEDSAATVNSPNGSTTYARTTTSATTSIPQFLKRIALGTLNH